MSTSTALVFVCESLIECSFWFRKNLSDMLWDMNVANLTVLTSDPGNVRCVPTFFFLLMESYSHHHNQVLCCEWIFFFFSSLRKAYLVRIWRQLLWNFINQQTGIHFFLRCVGIYISVYHSRNANTNRGIQLQCIHFFINCIFDSYFSIFFKFKLKYVCCQFPVRFTI